MLLFETPVVGERAAGVEDGVLSEVVTDVEPDSPASEDDDSVPEVAEVACEVPEDNDSVPEVAEVACEVPEDADVVSEPPEEVAVAELVPVLSELCT